MNSTPKQPGSYVHIYWTILIIIVVTLLSAKIISALWFPATAYRLQSGLPLLYFVLVMPFLLIIDLIEQFRLTDYVQRVHHQRPPLSNINLLALVTSDENYGDPIVDALKENLRKVIIFSMTAILIWPLISCVG